MKAKFAKWAPDVAPFETNVAAEAKNCLPGPGGKRPMMSLNEQTDALSATANGAIGAISTSGNAYNFVATTTDIYEQSANAWEKRTRSGSGSATPYNTGSGDRWEFDQWSNIVVGVNGHTDDPQQLTLGGAAFTALGGSPPKAKHLCIVGSFLMLGNVNDPVDGVVPNRVHWSAINDIGDFVPNISVQAGRADLRGNYGDITRMIGGDYAAIFRERAIARGDYAGPPGVFAFDNVETELGCPFPWSVVRRGPGRIIYFISDDGLYGFDGAQAVPVGTKIVNQWLVDNLDGGFPQNVLAAADPETGVYYWAFPSLGGGGTIDRLLCYDAILQEFTWGEQSMEWIGSLFSQLATNADDPGLNAQYPNADLVNISADSRQWAGGYRLLSGISTNHKLGAFNGPALAATIETADMRPAGRNRAWINAIRPEVVGEYTGSIRVGVRDRLDQSVSFLDAEAIDTLTGEAYPLVDAAYFRVRLDISSSGAWTHAIGVDINPQGAGEV